MIGMGGAISGVVIRIMIAHFHGTKETLGILAGIYSVVWVIGLRLIKENRETPDLWQALKHKLTKSSGDNKGEAALIKKRSKLGPLARDPAFWTFMLAIFFSCL
jgi:hypothetical protein